MIWCFPQQHFAMIQHVGVPVLKRLPIAVSSLKRRRRTHWIQALQKLHTMSGKRFLILFSRCRVIFWCRLLFWGLFSMILYASWVRGWISIGEYAGALEFICGSESKLSCRLTTHDTSWNSDFGIEFGIKNYPYTVKFKVKRVIFYWNLCIIFNFVIFVSRHLYLTRRRIMGRRWVLRKCMTQWLALLQITTIPFYAT